MGFSSVFFTEFYKLVLDNIQTGFNYIYLPAPHPLEINNKKAGLLYSTLEQLPLFQLPVNKADRSFMNAVFTMKNQTLEKEFIELCKKEGMVGVEGHRNVGGFRISLYNALPLSSVEAITALMKEFANKYAS